MNKALVKALLLVAMALPTLPLLGGDGETDQRFSIDLTMAGAGSNGKFLPIHLSNYEYGVLGPEGDQFYLRPMVNYRLDRHNFQLEAVADMVAYASTETSYYNRYIVFQQLYARTSWKKYFISIGRQQHKQRLVTHYLSSGNMVLSSNARQPVGIRGGMKDFVRMRVLDEKVEVLLEGFMGRLTDGRYKQNRYDLYEDTYGPLGANDPRRHGDVPHHLIQNTWMHYAAFMLRSQSDLPFYAVLGIEHAAMYGGKVDGTNQNTASGHFLTALGGKGKGKHGLNVQNNHLIAFDGKMKYKRKRWSTSVYRQIYADDLDGNAFRCGLDGLTGIELRFHRKPFFKLLVFEYLQSTRQGGVVYANDSYWYDNHKHIYTSAGNSNFYNDEWYGAWAHRGMAIGNPLLASPAYNPDGYNGFSKNIVRAFNFGMTGRFIEDFSYRLRYTFVKTWGTPYQPLMQREFSNSANLDLQYDWGQWQFIARVAYDHGQIFGNQWGYAFSVTHKGEIFNW